jgi:type II secretory pathway pseudopilin PulG
VRVEAIPTVELKSTPSGLSLNDFAPSLGAIIGLIGALVAVWMSGRSNKQTVEMAQRNNQASIEAAQRNNQAGIEAAQRNAEASIKAAQRNNEADLWQKANETELKDIQAKLDGFYGPIFAVVGHEQLAGRRVSGSST